MLMLVSSKQLPIGRSQSWDVLGGNESQWERRENMYEQQNRIADRRNSFGGDAGGWYEPPSVVCPSDMNMKREPYHYQTSLYNPNYVNRPDPCSQRKTSVPDVNNHYGRPPMTHRGSLTPQDPYQQDPAVFSRPPDGFYHGEQMPLNRSASHYAMIGVTQPHWNQSQSERSSAPAPTPAPPPAPPTRIYREPRLPCPLPATPVAKMMPEGQHIPSRAPSPAHYAAEATGPRYGAEASSCLPGCSLYSDFNGRPGDPNQPAATCLVIDPSPQGMVMRQESSSPYAIGQQQQVQQQKQEPSQQMLHQQMQQVHSFHQAQPFQPVQQEQPVQQPQPIQPVQQPQQIQPQQMQPIQQPQQMQPVQQMPLVHQAQPVQQGQPVAPPNPAFDANSPLPASAPVTAAIPTQGLPQLPTQPAPPPTTPQNSLTTVEVKKTADPEFLAFLRNEGLSESTIASLLQQGFDSTAMLAVIEQNDIHSVAPNLGQARVLSRVAISCKRPLDIPQHQSAPVRGRSNSFSHRSDIYVHQQPPMTPSMDSHYMHPPLTPVQTMFPRMADVMGRRPSSAPSQQLLEASGYPITRTPGPFSSAVMPVQPRSLSAYAPQTGLPMPSLSAVSQQVPLPSHIPGVQPQIIGLQQQMPPPIHGMPQQTSALTGLPQSTTMPTLPAQQAPKAYSTNYTVPMELMKRDRSLAVMSSLSNPQPSPHTVRKIGATPHEIALVPVGTAIQTPCLANQKLSRRTGPPVIVSTMAAPDTSKLVNFLLFLH